MRQKTVRNRVLGRAGSQTYFFFVNFVLFGCACVCCVQIAVLARDSSQNSVVDKVFKLSLKEFHTFLISTYSLSLQV